MGNPLPLKFTYDFSEKHNKGFPRIFEEYNHCSFKNEPRFFNKAYKGFPSFPLFLSDCHNFFLKS
jgi:hypothetical protein